MLAIAAQILHLTIWLAILAAIFIPLEHFFALRPQKILRPAIWVDLAYYYLSSLVPLLLLSLPVALIAWAAHKLVPWPIQHGAANLPLWARAVAGLIVGEIGFYWGHRWTHEIPLLWRFHAIHHSAEHLDFLVNSRAHPIDMVFVRLCGIAPLYVLGLGGPMVSAAGNLVPILVLLFGTLWGFFIHANLRWRLGFLESLISTPAFHHWHHTLDAPANRNFASTLPWLDRIFGTYHLPAKGWPDAYGIKGGISPFISDQILDPILPPAKKRSVVAE